MYFNLCYLITWFILVSWCLIPAVVLFWGRVLVSLIHWSIVFGGFYFMNRNSALFSDQIYPWFLFCRSSTEFINQYSCSSLVTATQYSSEQNDASDKCVVSFSRIKSSELLLLNFWWMSIFCLGCTFRIKLIFCLSKPFGIVVSQCFLSLTK